MDWLPDLVRFEDYGGDWHAYEDALYDIFCVDFVYSAPTFDGRRIVLKRYPLLKSREATFWHIISEGMDETERVPDLRRCERIRWPRAIVDHARAKGLLCWGNSRKNGSRIVIALPDFSYLVVLAERNGYLLMWTAYCVEYEHQRHKHRREYERSKI